MKDKVKGDKAIVKGHFFYNRKLVCQGLDLFDKKNLPLMEKSASSR